MHFHHVTPQAILVYLVFMVSIQSYAAPERKIFGQIGLAFAVIITMLLVTDYFIQFSVVPVRRNELICQFDRFLHIQDRFSVL